MPRGSPRCWTSTRRSNRRCPGSRSSAALVQPASRPMKISNFRTLVLGTPWRNLTYVVVETDEGLSGVGEARVLSKTHTVVEYLKDARRHIVGFDPFDIEALYRRMTLFDFGKPGEIVYTGLALIEMAGWG